MKLNDINIRDPYIIKAEGKYYMYGTRSATTWSYGDGFDCYISEDLENWEVRRKYFTGRKDSSQTSSTGHRNVWKKTDITIW